jgi:hypothetical protein
MEEIIRKEMTTTKWLFRLAERLRIITESHKFKSDMGVTEEDYDILKDLHRFHELGYIPMYENVIINKGESATSVSQADLFSTNTDKKDVTVCVDTICIGFDELSLEPTKEKK